jgi:hypothetical protein
MNYANMRKLSGDNALTYSGDGGPKRYYLSADVKEILHLKREGL